MKVLAIRGQNLASLARSFEVDLAHGPLAGVGLFAITGPVGAGKSTLLDALCLPLFDQTPRLRGRGGPQVADDGQEPGDWLRASDPRTLLRRDAAEGFAEVDFVGRDGGRYRARWSVRRARRRVDGRVQEQELQLRDLDRGIVVAAGRRSDVLLAVQQRLGLDFQQFCRSVLLAQGDFAAFLQAPADERAKLLETLTGAEIYRRLSKAAHERRREREHDVAKLQGQFDAQAGLAADVRAQLERSDAQWRAEIEVARTALRLAGDYVTWHEAAERHRQRESEATVALQRAQAAEAAAAPRRALLERRTRALAVTGRFEAAQEAQAALLTATGQADAAAAVARQQHESLAAACATFAQELARTFGPSLRMATEWDAAARAESLAAPTAAPTAEGAVLALAERLLTAVPLLRDLAPYEPLLQQWQQAEARAVALAASAPGLAAEVATTGPRAANARADALAATAADEAAQVALLAAQAAVETPRWAAVATQRLALEERRRHQRRERLLLEAWATATAAAAHSRGLVDEAQARATTAAAAVAPARTAEAAAAERVTAQREVVEGLRTRVGLATLRAQLVDGVPCPLCGSGAHPAARHDDGDAFAVAQQELTTVSGGLAAAQKAAAVAAAAAEQAQRDVERLQRAAQAAQATATAARAAVAAEFELAALTPAAALDQLAAAEAALAADERRLAADEAELASLRAAQQQALRAATTAAKELRARTERAHVAERERDTAAAVQRAAAADALAMHVRIDELRAALAPACGGLPEGPEALARLGPQRLARLRTLHDAHGVCAAARQRAGDAIAMATQAEQAAARAATAAATAATALAQSLASNGVALDDIVAAAQLGPHGLRAEAEVLQALRDEVGHGRTRLQERAQERQRHDAHGRPTLDVAEAKQALQDARAGEAAAQQRLDVVRAQLGADDLVQKQRAELLPRLSAATAELRCWGMLDDLIGSSTGDAFAVFAQGLTLDLLLIEANRRLAELARRYRLQRNAVGELDFVVVDLDLGGARRSVRTLSGGETFLVSLALALALATLAAPRSRVETLFLDEGFGTLDAQSLEQALGALDSLQAAGCQVGIISHVDGIAERIGAQVVVQPEGAGQSRVTARVR